jgi:hypothetical protein
VIAQSVQRWATGWTIGVLGFYSRRGLGTFLFTTASRTALGPTQPPIQWVPGALSVGVKRPEREADHSPPSSAESRMRGDTPPFPKYVFMAWCLVNAQGQLYLQYFKSCFFCMGSHLVAESVTGVFRRTVRRTTIFVS